MELKNGRCPNCGSDWICATENYTFWKCMGCGATSTGFIVDPLNTLNIKGELK